MSLWRAELLMVFVSTLPVSAQLAAIPQSDRLQPPVARAELPDAPLETVVVAKAETQASAHTGPRALNWSYWAVNGALVGATLADAQALSACPNCTFVPSAFHRSGLLYGAGLPADVLVMYLGYHLKKHGHRWWPVPAAALTAANAYLAYHFASSTN